MKRQVIIEIDNGEIKIIKSEYENREEYVGIIKAIIDDNNNNLTKYKGARKGKIIENL